MKILYYECFAGIAGDMNLGALIDLGVDETYLRNELSKLGVDDEFELWVRPSQKMGITGLKVDIDIVGNEVHSHNHNHEDHSHDHHRKHSHDHHHDHDGHSHHHHHDHEEHIHDHHHGRNYFDIEKLIEASDLSAKVKELSLAMFMKVAAAEAKVHGKPIDEVHFHEVGAIDSIVDIVGAAICYEKLGVDQVIASTLEVGSGFVKCAHGTMPVPAPATAEILAGIPVHRGGVKGEATTPTGAAILATLCDQFEDDLPMTITKTGYGVGTKDFEIPNLLRVSLGETKGSGKFKTEKLFLIETNIDDMNPELLPLVEDELWEQGVLDIWKTPIIMKKGRAATTLSVLVEENIKDTTIELLLSETTTLGVRVTEVDRFSLERNFVDVETEFGTITIKEGILNGRVIKIKPEFDQLRAAAQEHDVPITKVQEEAIRVYRERD